MLLEASFESGIPELYQDSNAIRPKKYMVYAFEYEGKKYGISCHSFKYEFDESDSELLLGVVGLAEDWFELSQAYLALMAN